MSESSITLDPKSIIIFNRPLTILQSNRHRGRNSKPYIMSKSSLAEIVPSISANHITRPRNNCVVEHLLQSCFSYLDNNVCEPNFLSHMTHCKSCTLITPRQSYLPLSQFSLHSIAPSHLPPRRSTSPDHLGHPQLLVFRGLE